MWASNARPAIYNKLFSHIRLVSSLRIWIGLLHTMDPIDTFLPFFFGALELDRELVKLFPHNFALLVLIQPLELLFVDVQRGERI